MASFDTLALSMSGLAMHNFQLWPCGLEVFDSFVREFSTILSLQNAGCPRKQEDTLNWKVTSALLVLLGLSTRDLSAGPDKQV